MCASKNSSFRFYALLTLNGIGWPRIRPNKYHNHRSHCYQVTRWWRWQWPHYFKCNDELFGPLNAYQIDQIIPHSFAFHSHELDEIHNSKCVWINETTNLTNKLKQQAQTHKSEVKRTEKRCKQFRIEPKWPGKLSQRSFDMHASYVHRVHVCGKRYFM